MAKYRTRFLLTCCIQLLLKHRTGFSYVMQQCSFYGYLFIKSYMFSHNTSYISNILKMLIQTDVSILFAFC